ncbi:MAG: hypothetical protein JXQ73_10150 [Phycisphaerae bacterium]|nr:hypothetical protein [Phycisphaerae bacterium]
MWKHVQRPWAVFRRRDLLWLLGLPIYQILGTIRHEASHALAAMAEGAKITEFVFLPSMLPGYGFAWGYVDWDGNVSWFSSAAPYFCDLVTFLAVFPICLCVAFKRKWVWLNLTILGVVSPLANSLYCYIRAFQKPGDVSYLRQVLVSSAVDGYFVVTATVYILGLLLVLCCSRTARGDRPT